MSGARGAAANDESVLMMLYNVCDSHLRWKMHEKEGMWKLLLALLLVLIMRVGKTLHENLK